MFARKLLYPLALAPLALAACSDSPTGSGSGASDVALRFGVVGAPGASASSGALFQTAAGQLVVTGANGTLTFDGIRVIVEEFELKGDDDVNPCERNGGVDDCEDFDAGPFFVDLPLSSAPISVSTGAVPPGTYREVEFEVEDLDDDEENPAEAARIAQLFQQIRAQFPDWPRDASMLVTGTFTPTGGQPRPFRVFIEAEIEVEVDLNPPLVVTEGSTQDVSILLDPAALFRQGGNVVDLSAQNGRLLRMELEVENGFSGRSGSNSGRG
ncbi:MAG TPA: hypothetical protein VF746_09575 [Longimicrobium sp.]|jgi:hypothetical protein